MLGDSIQETCAAASLHIKGCMMVVGSFWVVDCDANGDVPADAWSEADSDKAGCGGTYLDGDDMGGVGEVHYGRNWLLLCVSDNRTQAGVRLGLHLLQGVQDR